MSQTPTPEHRPVPGARTGVLICEVCRVRWPCLLVHLRALEDLPLSAGRARLRLGLVQ
jgi:hypothetical protein